MKSKKDVSVKFIRENVLNAKKMNFLIKVHNNVKAVIKIAQSIYKKLSY